MIRSSKHTIKFANKEKQQLFFKMCSSYKIMLNEYIKLIISGKLPCDKYLSSKALPIVNEIENSNWRQIAYKQAAQIVKGNITQQKKRIFSRYKKLYSICMKKNIHKNFTDKRFSELKINYLKRIKVNLKKVSIDLDYRICDIEKDKSKEFNEFIRIRLPFRDLNTKNRGLTVNIPIKYHKQSLKYKNWTRRNTIKLLDNGTIILVYDSIVNPEKPVFAKQEIGIDIGYKKLISDSNGKFYGKNLEAIYKKIGNKKRGSKSYLKSLNHRTNETNRIANEFLFKNDFDCLVLEDLKSVKFKSKLSRKTNNFMQYWSYRTLLTKLERLAEEEGFLLCYVNPAYTSQQCSSCGQIDKNSRNGESYHCSVCDMTMDADTNAAINILHRRVYSPSDKEN